MWWIIFAFWWLAFDDNISFLFLNILFPSFVYFLSAKHLLLYNWLCFPMWFSWSNFNYVYITYAVRTFSHSQLKLKRFRLLIFIIIDLKNGRSFLFFFVFFWDFLRNFFRRLIMYIVWQMISFSFFNLFLAEAATSFASKIVGSHQNRKTPQINFFRLIWFFFFAFIYLLWK